ncbi:P-loop containing nucleoside triphosphate hydrolase protein [Mycena rosella]|uniref:P-loop containing nucleoside triphosphate hydrolase protein n=1 Tax=Mycena rosella TaxID=1033263 RepID=A0AAD7DMS7_MYCRO|nr:P-loop containing nucleoside triphosphate hydrolase protein [Mycena rosella]
MAGDANRVAMEVSSLFLLYGAPMEIIIGSVFLYQLLGFSAFAGFVVLILGWPLNSYFSKRAIRIQKGVLKAKDKRMGVLNELISAVKLIKFFAWEQRWIDRTLDARNEEMKWMVKSRINDIGFLCLWVTAPIFISVISFFTYVMMGHELTISTAFTAIALFSMIRQPLNIIPTYIVQLLQTRVSLNRIAAYLDEVEVTEQVSSLKKDRSGPVSLEAEDDRLGFENASFKWNEVEDVPVADDGKKAASETDSIITTEMKLGQSLITNSSSKIFRSYSLKGSLRLSLVPLPDSLLMAVLGEMSPFLVAYYNVQEHEQDRCLGEHARHFLRAQSPWLRHQSIKDNILFGYPLDEARYEAVIEACALKPDLDMLEDGDATEIGERAYRCRADKKLVALARAVYAKTKYVLLDDPLSAVDSHTSRTLYEKCLRGPLLANRTVVLVTHHVELVLPGAHYLVRMLDGRIDTQGTVKELRAQGVLDDIAHDAAVEVKKEELAVASETPADELVEDEHREEGGVKWKIYKSYLKASSYSIWGFLALLVLLIQLLSVGEKLWIKTWSEAYKEKHNVALLVSVVRATFRFHDTTPQGRMLNRFGKDIETIDSSLASSLQQVNFSLAGFIASLLTVTIVFPLFLIPASFIGYFYYTFAVGYLNTGRDLRRMESNSRSPIFSDFGELLQGITKAFSAEKRFLDNLHARIDMTTKMWYTFWMTNRWLLLNFDFLGSLAVFFTSMFSIHVLVDNAGLAGLAITSALNFTTSVYWACRFWTGLELNLNSVERIIEYLDLPQEPPAVIESNRPPAYWPSSSKNDTLIVAENVSIKYAPELPAVLQDVSFSLKAGERIGLLGRTGSGKSTLAMSILRFTDPSSGIDISKIGVEDLRSRLTFIPQDATLFSGTLRENLDPFDEHDDATCLEVLYRVQMINRSNHASGSTTREHSVVASPDTSRPPSVAGGIEREETADSIVTALTDVDSKTVVSLDTQVSAGGTNFSQGQRQLIAMARALLRRSAIVVLDEATSSVDFKARDSSTDAKIQNTIREEFTDSLLLTIAHRLKTVIDYDRLLVLDKGKLVEFDTPLQLIEKEDGIFRSMCLKSGYFAELEASARAKAERDRGQ